MTPTQYTEHSDFAKTLPPTNLNIVITDNFKGFFMVIPDAKLIFCVPESVFGSKTITVPKIEGGEFTKIEFNFVKKLVDPVSMEMEKAWKPVLCASIMPNGWYTDPQACRGGNGLPTGPGRQEALKEVRRVGE